MNEKTLEEVKPILASARDHHVETVETVDDVPEQAEPAQQQVTVGNILMERAEQNAQNSGRFAPKDGHCGSSGHPMNPLIEAGLQARAAILDASLKYRAIARNRPEGMDLGVHLATDERVLVARARVERVLLAHGLIEATDLQFGIALTPVGLRVKTPTADILIPL